MIERSSVRSAAPLRAVISTDEHAPKAPTAGPSPLVWQLTADHLDWPSLRALLGTNRNARQGMLDAPPSQWRRAARAFVPRAAHKPADFANLDAIAHACLRYEIAQRNVEANTPVASHDEVFSDTVTAHAWSPDGVLLALGSRDGSVRVLDAAGASVLSTAHSCKVLQLAWSPDGRRCASGAMDGSVRILDTQSPQTSDVPHEGLILDLCWSPNGTYLVAPNSGRCRTLFNAQENRVVGSVLEGDSITSAAWSPDSTLLTVGCADGMVRLCRGDDARVVASHRHLVYGVGRVWGDPVLHSAWSSNGTMVLNVGSEQTLSVMTSRGEVQPVKSALLPSDVRVPPLPERILESGGVDWAPDGTSSMICKNSRAPLTHSGATVTVQRFAP